MLGFDTAFLVTNVWRVWRQDDGAQFFKEEIEEGVAVYNVYLKKVHYHTSINDVSCWHNTCTPLLFVRENKPAFQWN